MKSLSQTLGLALITVFSLSAQESAQIHLSAVEVQEIFDNPTRSYVYVGREVSNLADIIAEISKLDSEENSPVRALEEHINKGFVIGNYEGVAFALEHAENLLNQIEPDRTSNLSRALNAIVEQVAAEQLTLDAAMLEAANVQAPETKACGTCNSHCLRKLVIKEKADFLNKVKFYEDVTFKDEVTFEDNVIIDGTLSVTDLIVLSCMDSLCVNNLSITNEIIANLSVVNAVVTNLSVTNEVVTNLSVTNEIVTNLTATTLSATDIFAQTLSTCDVIVGCDILMNNSTSAAVGNIVKGGNRFLSNFGTNNAFVGQNSGNFTTTGSDNSGFGTNALTADTTGSFNTAVGSGALSANTIGAENVAIGFNAMLNNTTGFWNTAVGRSALGINQTGIQNTAIGFETLQNNIVNNNTAVGFAALQSNTTGTPNTAVGFGALQRNTIGTNNVAVGDTLNANTTGSFNTAIGSSALNTNTIGVDNTAVGYQALLVNTTGVSNTAVGQGALSGCTTGSDNIAVGSGAGATLTIGSGNIYINANAAVAAEATTTRIGTAQTACFIAGINGVTTGLPAVAVLVDGNGQLGTVSSSKTVKHNIQDMNDVSASIYNLNPVTFAYNSDASETTQYGLIAEEVADVFPGIVVRNANGQPETVQYHVLPVLLLNEFKKLAARVAVLEMNA